ncbi:MAG TPA: 50S ribosomal protein L31 [Chloroflexota bacterium]|jgi:large subunit ribosomal protein L31|nr:50S ribosomal protein L31 [Chloroflexota bacterium]
MKKNIHPNWVKTTVVCSCGNTFETFGTKELVKVELCSRCHPYYTGQQRIVDTGGQVERFMRRMAKAGRTEEAGGIETPAEPTPTS